MSLSPEEIQQLVVKITEAEAEYHNLLVGNKARVFVDQNGERVEFVSANANKLYVYIQNLKTLLAANTAPPQHAPIGPAGFLF